MNLTSRLPDTVEVGRRRLPICTDFRVGIRFEQLIVQGEADAAGLLALYFPDELPEYPAEAVEAALWFYRCGMEEENGKGAPPAPRKAVRGYDFAQDADALYSSFLAVYGVDLLAAELHWWAFRTLMNGLPPECPFMQRVFYRTVDTKGMTKAQQKQIAAMRKRYALRQARIGETLTLLERDSRMKTYVDRRFTQAGA